MAGCPIQVRFWLDWVSTYSEPQPVRASPYPAKRQAVGPELRRGRKLREGTFSKREPVVAVRGCRTA